MLVGASVACALRRTIGTYELNNAIRVNLVNLGVRLVNSITVNKLRNVGVKPSEYKLKEVVEEGKEEKEERVKVLRVTYC